MMTVQLPTADTRAPIEVPTACAPYDVGDGITVLPSYLPVPGMGVLPAHAFLIDGPEPTLVDTGPGGAEVGFTAALASVVDPSELRWLWLTHTDPDHIGSLQWLLDNAPHVRLITTYLAVGKLGMQMPVPMDRLYWVNPGTTVELNNRKLQAIRPPSFDAPETTAFFDHTSGTLFSADSFGALLQRPTYDASDIAAGDLADGMALWSTIDSPWLTHTDRSHFDQTLSGLRDLEAARVLSAHLPPAVGRTPQLLDNLATVVGIDPWTGPDQAALEQILSTVHT
jgi:glyoxylase-like metal-dependent hydrolase (beta-lactamase superfamily II)